VEPLLRTRNCALTSPSSGAATGPISSAILPQRDGCLDVLYVHTNSKGSSGRGTSKLSLMEPTNGAARIATICSTRLLDRLKLFLERAEAILTPDRSCFTLE
jgi:hypothetical protein